MVWRSILACDLASLLSLPDSQRHRRLLTPSQAWSGGRCYWPEKDSSNETLGAIKEAAARAASKAWKS
jgi:hypothetical protein